MSGGCCSTVPAWLDKRTICSLRPAPWQFHSTPDGLHHACLAIEGSWLLITGAASASVNVINSIYYVACKAQRVAATFGSQAEA